MSLRIIQVDAFTDKPFGGNPAAVCVLESPREEAWMQSVALEMNLSETAFLHPEKDGWRLRWFTPAVEVALCGHATLASAHVLWEEERLPAASPARFYTKSGPLVATRQGREISMDFPAKPIAPAEAPAGLLDGLGAEGLYVGSNKMDFLVELDSERAVRALSPNFSQLRKVQARGVIVTARSEEKRFDFISRFFAPAAGVDEDPVTGSAHCALGPYWSAKLGKKELVGFQASARGGIVRVRCHGERVDLIGSAITVLRGELLA